MGRAPGGAASCDFRRLDSSGKPVEVGPGYRRQDERGVMSSRSNKSVLPTTRQAEDESKTRVPSLPFVVRFAPSLSRVEQTRRGAVLSFWRLRRLTNSGSDALAPLPASTVSRTTHTQRLEGCSAAPQPVYTPPHGTSLVFDETMADGRVELENCAAPSPAVPRSARRGTGWFRPW